MTLTNVPDGKKDLREAWGFGHGDAYAEVASSPQGGCPASQQPFSSPFTASIIVHHPAEWQKNGPKRQKNGSEKG